MVKIVMRLESNLAKRVITACLLMPLTIGILFYAPLMIKQYIVLFIFGGLTYEWSRFTPVHFAFLGGITLLIGVFLLYTMKSNAFNDILIIGFVTLPFLLIYGYKDKLFAIGQVYILAAMLILCAYLTEPIFLLWMLILIWLNDSFAYFSGRFFGGPKLCPSISPKKTCSGFIGGVFIGTLASGTLASHLDLIPSPYIMSFVLSIVGHGGDLLESATKRHYNIKDSSQILPGHGGLLDRLDSFLAILIIFQIIQMARYYMN
ncbi:MAG: phosphatidate cytidylyltransferase [Alphaproteobacteria bacterium]|nr:phosphatidate cytidylyltransferase [Alphaproteobacteria bacterium]